MLGRFHIVYCRVRSKPVHSICAVYSCLLSFLPDEFDPNAWCSQASQKPNYSVKHISLHMAVQTVYQRYRECKGPQSYTKVIPPPIQQARREDSSKGPFARSEQLPQEAFISLRRRSSWKYSALIDSMSMTHCSPNCLTQTLSLPGIPTSRASPLAAGIRWNT